MGVKSLWTLIAPAGRPIMLETVEGKSMAIDSSIWIYQFQATMRDKEGRGLVNAHVLGFLRRICKLLFYGIKPVFVFDGGAPALKRMTIAERKKRKSGAAESHEKVAQKLLAAQMRREALNHAQSSSKDTNRPPQGPVTLDEDTVYLEDLDASAPRTPERNKGKAKESLSTSAKKSRWRDHDPYRLPDVDMDAAVVKATRTTAPDPRLATEDELREFIELMRPEDLDVKSPAFRELPTEVQYEIIGDLRLKSRQTSHKRLQAMLRSSRTALDFSRQQIQLLKQRNALTQQLLETTDSIGKANVTIPIRIAAERNKEYILVKNDDEIGGWVLGIRDDGTEEKPIVLDNADEHIKSDDESDDDMDMEEVSIPQAATPDADLREYQRGLALAAVTKRQAAAAARGRPSASIAHERRATKEEPLFIPDEDDEDANIDYESDVEWEEIENAELTTAMQTSLEDQEANDLRKAIDESCKANRHRKDIDQRGSKDGDLDDDLYVDYTPSRLDTALRFAYSSREPKVSPPVVFPRSSVRAESPSPAPQKEAMLVDEDDEDMEEVVPLEPMICTAPPDINDKEIDRSVETVPYDIAQVTSSNSQGTAICKEGGRLDTSSDEAGASPSPLKADAHGQTIAGEVNSSSSTAPGVVGVPRGEAPRPHTPPLTRTSEVAISPPAQRNSPKESGKPMMELQEPDSSLPIPQRGVPADSAVAETPVTQATTPQAHSQADQSDSEVSSGNEGWTRPGSPGGSQPQEAGSDEQREWDAAEEMNVHEETGEFARFAAQVRGRDLETVRAEIDDEIRLLREERKAAMRDAEDVNQAMVAQIMAMLRLFGIPYITAPMEAEAQCATLVELGLVDGVITDDSDVFLFGAKRVYKNMFNQSKTVECFLLTDLARELGLDRGTLIRLAYLLGSDYTAGLPGVGPVVAMELLKEFPGDDGLHKFKDWWSKVQTGRDTDVESASTFRKRFKKRFKDMYLPSDWPNPAVRDAYYHPVVDASEEPFKWGLPDLDALRSFFHDELGWNVGKVDELLLPIIQKMNKRGQEQALNRQGTLNTFFDVSEGAGIAEPRRREAYASRRLQALVSAHRKAQKQRTQGKEEPSGGESDEEVQQPVKKRRTKPSPRSGEGEDSNGGTSGSRKGKGKATGNGRGRKQSGIKAPSASGEGPAARRNGKKATASRTKAKGKARKVEDADVDSDSEDAFVGTTSDAPVREIELRKRVRPRPAYKGAQQAADNVDFTKSKENEEAGVDDSDSGGSEYQG